LPGRRIPGRAQRALRRGRRSTGGPAPQGAGAAVVGPGAGVLRATSVAERLDGALAQQLAADRRATPVAGVGRPAGDRGGAVGWATVAARPRACLGMAGTARPAGASGVPAAAQGDGGGDSLKPRTPTSPGPPVAALARGSGGGVRRGGVLRSSSLRSPALR